MDIKPIRKQLGIIREGDKECKHCSPDVLLEWKGDIYKKAHSSERLSKFVEVLAGLDASHPRPTEEGTSLAQIGNYVTELKPIVEEALTLKRRVQGCTLSQCARKLFLRMENTTRAGYCLRAYRSPSLSGMRREDLDYWKGRSLGALADFMLDFKMEMEERDPYEPHCGCAQLAEVFSMHPLLVPEFLCVFHDAIQHFGFEFVKQVMDDQHTKTWRFCIADAMRYETWIA